jgi:lysozyme
MVESLTPKIVANLARLEGLCLEAYRDSGGVWTWALGVTNPSGHQVYPRYLDKPQSLKDCLTISIWLLREKYLPPVLSAFKKPLTEAQLAAALSFHWNTGAISTTSWVKLFNEGKVKEAEQFLLTHYLNNGILKSRRQAEADLFFRGKWPTDMRCPLYQVDRNTYKPVKPKPIDILPELYQLLI